MKTLNANYQKNVDILIENIKRGMTSNQIDQVITSQKSQFIKYNLYNQPEKDYIQELENIKNKHFIKASTLAEQMGITVVHIE